MKINLFTIFTVLYFAVVNQMWAKDGPSEEKEPLSYYINLNPLSGTNFCLRTNITVQFTSNMPAGTSYYAELMRGTTVVANQWGSSTTLNIFPYDESLITYGTDYYIRVRSGSTYSANSPYLTLGEITSVNIADEAGYNDPTNFTLCNGATKKLNVQTYRLNNILSNPDNTTYKWYKNNVLLSGETGKSILVSNSGSYKVEVTQAGCKPNIQKSVSNSTTGLLFTAVIIEGEDVICNGLSKRMLVNYNSQTSTYKWYKDGAIIPGANAQSYTTTSSGSYYSEVTETGCGVSKSYNSPKLTFSNSIFPKVSNSGDSTLCSGEFVVLSCKNLEDKNLPYTYQWQNDGVDMTGSTQINLIVYQPGKYRLKISQGSCTSFSKEYKFERVSQHAKPIIVSNYDSVCVGTIRMRSEQTESDPMNGNIVWGRGGNWYKDNVLVASYGYAWYEANTSGTYKLVVGAGTPCENTSDEKVIVIGQLSKPIIRAPIKNICGSSDYVDLRFFNPEGNMSSFTYKWKKDGNYISGATSQGHLAFTSGSYQLEVSNGLCTALSDPVIVTQSSTPSLQLEAQNLDLYCSNGLSFLKASRITNAFVTPYNPLTWYRNGTILPSETLTTIYTNVPGNYYFAYNNTGCSGVSNTVSVTSGPPTGFSVSPPLTEIEQGSSAIVQIASCSGEIKWYDAASGGTLIYTGNPYTTPSLTVNTSYWVTCEVGQCESTRVKVDVIVGGCPNAINHNGVPVLAKEYKAGQYINASVNLPTNVRYNAGKAIILSPGFEVGANETFEAVIGGCND